MRKFLASLWVQHFAMRANLVFSQRQRCADSFCSYTIVSLSKIPRGVTMDGLKGLASFVAELKATRKNLADEIRHIDAALTVLGKMGGGTKYTRPSHTMSAAARRKISFAQKARWAKTSVKVKRRNRSAPCQRQAEKELWRRKRQDGRSLGQGEEIGCRKASGALLLVCGRLSWCSHASCGQSSLSASHTCNHRSFQIKPASR